MTRPGTGPKKGKITAIRKEDERKRGRGDRGDSERCQICVAELSAACLLSPRRSLCLSELSLSFSRWLPAVCRRLSVLSCLAFPSVGTLHPNTKGAPGRRGEGLNTGVREYMRVNRAQR